MLIIIGNQKFRALVDTGAEVSTISRKICEQKGHIEVYNKLKSLYKAQQGIKLKWQGC